MKLSHNNVRFLLVSLSVLLLLFLTGCWSKHEIEDINLIIGSALDKGEESTDRDEYQKNTRLTLTLQFINPQAIGSSKKGGGSQQKSYINVTSETGATIYALAKETTLKREGIVYGEHQKLIIIGEDLAREVNLQQLLDLQFRNSKIRGSRLVFIARGRASKALESKETTVIPSFRLIEMSENPQTTTILPSMSLAKLTGKLHSGSSFLLQNVSSSNGEVKFAGAAVIKGKTKKLIGFLSKEELGGITWITGKGKAGIVEAFDQETGQPIVYEVKSMKSRITPHVDGNNISFDVNIESEGRLSENWVISGDPSEDKFLKKVEKTAEKEVKNLVKNVIKKMQKKYKVDVAGFGNRLRIEHPKVWEKVKKDWDQTFSEVPIKYNVKLTIKEYGTSISTSKAS